MNLPATKTRTGRTNKPANPPENDEDFDGLDEPPEFVVAPSDEETQLGSLLDELGGETGVNINVYRMPGKGEKRQSFCFACTPGDFDVGGLLTRIQNEFGGGDYMIVPRNATGMVRRLPVTIASSPKKEPAAIAQSQPDLAATIVQAVGAAMQPLIQPLAQLVQRPPSDPMQEMTRMFTLMRGMREAMGLTVPQVTTPAPQTDLLGKLKEITELKQQLAALGFSDGEGGDGTTSLISLVTAFKEPLMEIVSKLAAQKAAASAMPAISHNNAQVPAPGLPPQTGAATMPNPFATLQPYFAQLLQAARGGANPETTADMILDLTPDAQLPQLLELVQPEDSPARIVAVYPGFAPFAEWLGALRFAILEAITEPEIPDDVPIATPSGDDAPADSPGNQ